MFWIRNLEKFRNLVRVLSKRIKYNTRLNRCVKILFVIHATDLVYLTLRWIDVGGTRGICVRTCGWEFATSERMCTYICMWDEERKRDEETWTLKEKKREFVSGERVWACVTTRIRRCNGVGGEGRIEEDQGCKAKGAWEEDNGERKREEERGNTEGYDWSVVSLRPRPRRIRSTLWRLLQSNNYLFAHPHSDFRINYQPSTDLIPILLGK